MCTVNCELQTGRNIEEKKTFLMIGQRMSENESELQKYAADSADSADTPAADAESKIFVEHKLRGEVDSCSWSHAVPQIIASCIAYTIVIQVGLNMSYSSSLIPELENAGKINTSEASWIASLFAIAMPFGSLAAGPLMDKFGRKILALISCPSTLISWLILANATNTIHFYIGRFIGGMSAGFTTAAVVYVSEIAHATMRPMLLCLNSVFVSFGIMLSFILTYFFDRQQIALICAGLTIATFALLFFIPESPQWTIKFRQDTEKAMNDLRWFYRNPNFYNLESLKLIDQLKQTAVTDTTDDIPKLTVAVMQKKTVYKPLIIILIIFLIQQLIGGYAVIVYAKSLLVKVGGISKETVTNTALVALGVIRFGMSIAVAGLSHKIGPRALLLSSAAGICLFTTIGILTMYINDFPGATMLDATIGNSTREFDEVSYSILLVSILGIVLFNSLGFLIIPWTLIGILLPIEVKAKLGGLLMAFAYILMFGVLKIFPFALKEFGLIGIFVYFTIVTILGSIYIYHFLPDTLGKTFIEINRYFNKN